MGYRHRSMKRVFVIAIGVALCSCSPAGIAKDYSRYSECPEDKIQVTQQDSEFTTEYASTFRASGCGNGADYVCNDYGCFSPMITVARRHAKQFKCGVEYVSVEYLEGGSWLASGCDHEFTYQCVSSRSEALRCIAETDDRRPRSE